MHYSQHVHYLCAVVATVTLAAAAAAVQDQALTEHAAVLVLWTKIIAPALRGKAAY